MNNITRDERCEILYTTTQILMTLVANGFRANRINDLALKLACRLIEIDRKTLSEELISKELDFILLDN